MGKGTGAGGPKGGAGGGPKGRPGGNSASARGAGSRGTGSRPSASDRGSGTAGPTPDRREARRRWARAHHRHYHNELRYQGDYGFQPRRSNAQTIFVIAVLLLIVLGVLLLVSLIL